MAEAVGWYGRKRTRELALIVCFLAPSLAIFLLYRLIPLGWNVVLSFQSWSPMRPARSVRCLPCRVLVRHSPDSCCCT